MQAENSNDTIKEQLNKLVAQSGTAAKQQENFQEIMKRLKRYFNRYSEATSVRQQDVVKEIDKRLIGLEKQLNDWNEINESDEKISASSTLLEQKRNSKIETNDVESKTYEKTQISNNTKLEKIERHNQSRNLE